MTSKRFGLGVCGGRGMLAPLMQLDVFLPAGQNYHAQVCFAVLRSDVLRLTVLYAVG